MSKAVVREHQIEALRTEEFDVVVIGGGATGAGTALEASLRGLKVALLERYDFSSGTSSRSTKLLHGGVRYLEAAFKKLDPGQFLLVKDALAERKTLLEMAPHLARKLELLVPLEHLWEIPYFFSGLVMYDLMAGSKSLGRSRLLSKKATLDLFPTLDSSKFKGGVVYFDGQFDDARMNVEVVLAAQKSGAIVSNYLEVTGFGYNDTGKVSQVVARDEFSGATLEIKTKSVLNATGPYSDNIRRLDDPECDPMLMASSGAHIIVDKKFSPGATGMLIPKTSDGRVVFVLPWNDYTLIGTTDEAAEISDDPQSTEKEIEYILETTNRYLDTPIKRSDVLSSWSGLRPLVAAGGGGDTAKLSRDHVLVTSSSGIVTITGGKWTTFRKMASDALKHLVKETGIETSHDVSKPIKLPGGEGYDYEQCLRLLTESGIPTSDASMLVLRYGSQVSAVAELMSASGPVKLHEESALYEAEVRYCVRHELVQKAQDFLSRRTRLRFLNEKHTKDVAQKVLGIISEELEFSDQRLKKEQQALSEWLNSF